MWWEGPLTTEQPPGSPHPLLCTGEVKGAGGEPSDFNAETRVGSNLPLGPSHESQMTRLVLGWWEGTPAQGPAAP